MRPRNILVVEDELLIGKDLINSLILDGFENVNLVNSSDGAIEFIEHTNTPDVVIMDIALEGNKKNGILTAQKIKDNYDVPVVFLTGYADMKTRHYAEKASPYGFLTKPVKHSDISIALETAFSRHKEECQIKRNEEKFRVITEEAFLSIFIIQNRKIVYANESFFDLTGYSLKEVNKFRNNDILNLFSERGNNSHYLISDLLSVIKPKQLSLSCPVISKDKKVKWVDLYSKIIKFNNRHARLVTLVDITERKMVEKQNHLIQNELNRKNDELDKLIHIASQDLRSPLLNIHGFGHELENSINELKRVLGNNKKLRNLNGIVQKDIPEALSFILSSTHKMETMIGGILKLARIKREILNDTQINVRYILDRIIRNNEEIIKDKKIKVEIISPIRKVVGDQKLLTMALEKIIENSIMYTDSKKRSKIIISSEKREGSNLYCIHDNGIGISPYFVEKVFNFYTRVDENFGEGDGIGLTLVKEIVDSHNGKCWIESVEGKWTRFYLELPN